MLKHIISYGVCVFIIFSLFTLWQNRRDQVKALSIELNTLYATLEEKSKESNKEDIATLKRDKEYENLDKRLSAINANLRKISASNQEINTLLHMRIPPELLRGLKTYNKCEAASSNTPTGKAENRK